MSDLTVSQALLMKEARIEEINGHIRDLSERLDALQNEREKVAQERIMLRDLLEQFQNGSTPEDPFLTMSRTDAVEFILRQSKGPITPKGITAEAHRLGRKDTYEALNAALAHLARTERAYSPERGQWLHGTPPEPEYDEDDLAADLLTAIGRD